jgi:hypothetical protein
VKSAPASPKNSAKVSKSSAEMNTEDTSDGISTLLAEPTLAVWYRRPKIWTMLLLVLLLVAGIWY